MNKKINNILILILIVIPLVNAEVPKIVPYVNDFANVLSDDEELKLNLLCDSIEKNTSYEIAIVTISNTEGMDRIEYANKIGDLNGVGKKDQDNGVVVLWSLDNEKGGAIATGRFSESILNDAKVGRIGRESRKYFDGEKYYEGFDYIINEIRKEINNESKGYIETIESNELDMNSFIFFIIIFVVIIFLIKVFASLLESNDDSSDSSSSYRGYSGGYSSGSSSSSSSRGFGGGSFGGGGARF